MNFKMINIEVTSENTDMLEKKAQFGKKLPSLSYEIEIRK